MIKKAELLLGFLGKIGIWNLISPSKKEPDIWNNTIGKI